MLPRQSIIWSSIVRPPLGPGGLKDLDTEWCGWPRRDKSRVLGKRARRRRSRRRLRLYRLLLRPDRRDSRYLCRQTRLASDREPGRDLVRPGDPGLADRHGHTRWPNSPVAFAPVSEPRPVPMQPYRWSMFWTRSSKVPRCDARWTCPLESCVPPHLTIDLTLQPGKAMR
jgi:hypothetical protein